MKDETMNTERQHCADHSGCTADIKNLKEETKDQWVVIREIEKRPPVWATSVISVLSFFLGCALTYAGLMTKFTNII